MTLGEKIRYLRNEKEISQEDFAPLLSVSRYILMKWESNEIAPSTNEIANISKLLDTSIDYLLNEAYRHKEDVPGSVEHNKLRKANRNINIMIFILIFMTIVLSAIPAIALIQDWNSIDNVILIAFIGFFLLFGFVAFIDGYSTDKLKIKQRDEAKGALRRVIDVWYAFPLPIFFIIYHSLSFFFYPVSYNSLFLASLIIFIVSASHLILMVVLRYKRIRRNQLAK
ncbi:MAG: helix-turn-helix domain-containing protein [Defluviitaleaceae bacterium]|nr:helix-turn-helix domain-containing protein [Defluviitaleaceae bacterium]